MLRLRTTILDCGGGPKCAKATKLDLPVTALYRRSLIGPARGPIGASSATPPPGPSIDDLTTTTHLLKIDRLGATTQTGAFPTDTGRGAFAKATLAIASGGGSSSAGICWAQSRYCVVAST